MALGISPLGNTGPRPYIRAMNGNSSGMAQALKRGTIALLSAATLMLALGTASAESVTSERLRLRPLKEPVHCVGSGVCPLVSAPRVGHRRSTIPGISNPDH